jgi:hypothetical protein
MRKTKLMDADEIVQAFNGANERMYWKAALGGTRTNPVVHFNSRASMVRVTYAVATGEYVVSFSQAACAWGDFLASAFRSLAQITANLKAAGLDVSTAVADTTRLRVEYDPATKSATIHLANHGDAWQEAEPMAFKVPERAT